MRRGASYICLGAVTLMLLVCCSPNFGIATGNRLPISEASTPLDRDKFLAYIDTTAVDDWEGLWLLVGPNLHCHLAIERINDMSSASYYTHRIRMWSSLSYNTNMYFQPGEILGYLGQGLFDNTKNMVLQVGTIYKNKAYNGMVQLDKNRKVIIIDLGYKNEGDIGLRRIYPIRSKEEREYKVRYL